MTKTAAEQAKEITKRLNEWRNGNNPVGLPKPQENQNKTITDYPTAGWFPQERGFDPNKCIAGTGGGPIITTNIW